MGRLRLIDGGLNHPSKAPSSPTNEFLGDEEATVVSIVTASALQPEVFEAEVEAALGALTEIASPAPPPQAPPAYAQFPEDEATSFDARALAHAGPQAAPPAMMHASPPPAMMQQPDWRASQPMMHAQPPMVEPFDPSRPSHRSHPMMAYPPRSSQPLPSAPYYADGSLADEPVHPQAMRPSQMLVPAPERRSRRGLWITLIALVTAGGGVAIGWALFARDDTAEPAPAASAPAKPAAVVAAQAPATVAPDPKPADPRPADPKPVDPKPADPPRVDATEPADITKLEHPMLEPIASPARGEIAAVSLTAADVKVGDALVAIRARKPASLAAARRVAELEVLARQDPASYRPFLARAQRELARQQSTEVTTVKATAPGHVEARVKVGDRVDAGATIAVVVDPRTWIATATVRGAVPTASWSCIVATPDNTHTAACKIQTTEVLPEGGTRVTVEFSAATTAWLDNLAQHPRIVVEAR